MGCGGSTDSAKGSNGNSTQNSYDRRPKISVRIGPEVGKLNGEPSVIFIFGGPGSRKGRIVDDLVGSYGFKFICVEELILQELPKSVSQEISEVKDIRGIIEEDPSLVTIDWIISAIDNVMKEDPGATYLIDYLPNLRYMLKVQAFSKDCAEPMRKFEEKFPVSFALNLAIPADKVLKTKQMYAAKPANRGEAKDGGQSDEADSGRTQKRAAMFEQSARPFLDYFSKKERLVTVDVTCGVADLIWHQVNSLLCDLEFHPTRVVNTVMAFVFDNEMASSIDYEKYLLKRVNLAEEVDDPQGSVDSLLKQLNKYMNNCSKETDSFVIMCEGTSITKNKAQKVSKSPLVFLDVEEGPIETYLPGSPKNYKPHANATKYKAVCSLENEACLFPPDTDTAVIQQIGSIMASLRMS